MFKTVRLSLKKEESLKIPDLVQLGILRLSLVE